MLNQQLLKMDIGTIADVFLKSWHPLIEMEQISARTLAESMGYWGDLLPITERWSEPELEPRDTEFASINEAQQLGLIPEEGFADTIEDFWRECFSGHHKRKDVLSVKIVLRWTHFYE